MTFVEFARSCGLLIDHAIADGRWHRVPTTDKPRKRNGAYVLDQRGGAVRNWATMDEFASWRETGHNAPSVDWARLNREARQAERTRRQRAIHDAQSLIQRAQRVIPRATVRRRGGMLEGIAAHPYLVRKGHPRAAGLVVDGRLLVPMYDYERGALVGAQLIGEDGEKRFVPGTRAKGAIHALGQFGRTWLVEGYATGLSVRMALDRMYLGGRVWVCFSAGNVAEIAKHGIGDCVIVADNDESGVGQRMAERSGRPYLLPDEQGDANDLHLRRGIGAVVELLRRACEVRMR